MQLVKWIAAPAVVLILAAALASAGWFGPTWMSVAVALANLATLLIWRRATYRLAGSIKNIDHERLDSDGQRIFKTIFAVTSMT